MTSPQLEEYLSRLERELRRRGLADARILDEARGHLVDAIEHALQNGLARDAAEREAFARFGAPEIVAAHFAAERHRARNRLLFIAASTVGLVVAYMGSQSTGVEAAFATVSMMVFAAAFGMIAPDQPWRWALAIGIWTPIEAVARASFRDGLEMLLVLIFPLSGAYAGVALRRVLSARLPIGEPRGLAYDAANRQTSGYHDYPGGRLARHHFAVRFKRRVRKRLERMSPDERRRFVDDMKERGMDISTLAAFATGTADPAALATAARADLVRFLGHAGPRIFGPEGTLESLTLLENTTESTRHVARYLAVFATGAKMVWTIVHTSDGSVSLDGVHAG
jgi:hypothetical protein